MNYSLAYRSKIDLYDQQNSQTTTCVCLNERRLNQKSEKRLIQAKLAFLLGVFHRRTLKNHRLRNNNLCVRALLRTNCVQTGYRRYWV